MGKEMTRREMLRKLGGAAAGVMVASSVGGWLPASASKLKRKPNVVFILADDLGWMDTSLYGSKFYETPNIDRLAKRGMMFTQAYSANPLCSPTRASIMTGLYPARIGITLPYCHMREILTQNLEKTAPSDHKALQAGTVTRLKQEYHTLAEALKDSGYATGHFGKWHLGPEPYDPLHQGFDVDIPHTPAPGPPGSYFAPWPIPNFEGEPGEYIEDRMGKEAVNFIRSNKDNPFFLNYWCFSVHSPWTAKPDLMEKYRKKADPKSAQRNHVMGAMVQSMDENIGRVIDEIDILGLAENTIFVFFSDNGGVAYTQVDGIQVTSNAPLRGGKATIFEGGTREPCIVVWPGVVKPGSRSEEVISSIDWHPTVLEMLGVGSQLNQRFDGMSIVPALKGKRLDREAIFCHFPHYIKATEAIPATYVRKDDWKLIRFYCDNDDQSDRFELYNLKDDISETNDLAARYPKLVKKLNALIDQFLKDTNAVVPKPNPDYKPTSPR